MRITVRRKESVSSILLFLFNVFLVERGVTSIPLRKIFKLLQPFGKNETTIRMGLSREVKGETLVNEREGGEVVYRLTDAALAGFKHWMSVMDHARSKILLQSSPWDGRWRIAAVRGDDGSGPVPTELRELLLRFGYGKLNRDTWISPYDRRANLEAELGSTASALPRLVWFECAPEGEADRSRLAAEVWPVADIGRRYRSFLGALAGETAAEGDGRELPILYRLGLEYFEIAQDDPRLPLALLPPDWAGPEAASAFGKLRGELLPAGQAFVDRVLGES
jgi:phenylacetic acid degradation operon negative regulatory protein